MGERESKRLKRSFIQLSHLMENSSAMVVAIDSRGRILLTNLVFEEATGYGLDEIQQKYVWDIFLPPRELEFMRAIFRNLKPEQMPDNYVSPWMIKDGSSLLVAWSIKALLDKDESLEGFICTGIDITERKRVEEALRRSEAQFRSLIDGAMDIIVVMGADGIIRFISPAVERVLGYRPQDLLGTSGFDLLHPEDLPEYLEALEDGLRKPGHTKFVEGRTRHRDGSWRTLEAVGRNLLADPAVHGIVINCRDVTERRRYETELRDRAGELRNFLGVAAHELRHPITVIKGYVSTLENYLEKIPPESIPSMLKHIGSANDRLAHIVSDLVNVSRIEQGCFPVEPVMTELEPLLEKAVEEMQARFPGHRFKVRAGVYPVPVRVDEDRCVQLLIILLENAVNFSPPTNPIEIEVERRDNEVRVSVQDLGPGVPEEARTRIFDRFYQLEDLRHHSTPGLGLGLYIAREIVEAHGGRIWYEPRTGGGSVFRFTLPTAAGKVRHLREAAGA